MDPNKSKKKKHIYSHAEVFPKFYGPEADKEWEDAEKRDKLPIERRRKPKKKFRIR